MSNQYGLILNDKQASKKAHPLFSASKNVFGNESDSEEEVGVPKAPLLTGEKLHKAAEDEKEDKAKRTNRKRKSSGDVALSKENENSDSGGEINKECLADPKKTQTHQQSNKDADSDSSIDSSSSDDEDNDEKPSGSKKSKKAKESNTEESEVATVQEEKPDEDNFMNPDDVERAEQPVVNEEAIEEVELVRPKINVSMKTTVGIIINEALKRCIERMSQRGL